MSNSIPDSQRIAEVWAAVKDRSVPLKPLTKAEYDVLDSNSKNADVVYLVNNSNRLEIFYKGATIGNGEKSYQNGETVIGTWIDGKPLYRMVTSVTTPNTGATRMFVYSELNIDTIVSIGGYIRLANASAFLPLPSVYISTNEWFAVYDNRSREAIVFVAGVNEYRNRPCELILEYTKTTD